VLEYLPAAQTVHSADPLLGLYLPATQEEQIPFAPVHPALQTHAVTTMLPADENECAGQAAQSPAPDPYVPGMQTQLSDTGTVEIAPVPHNVHVLPLPRKPSLQTQLSDTGTVEFVFVPHTVHVMPSPRKPLLQLVHTSV